MRPAISGTIPAVGTIEGQVAAFLSPGVAAVTVMASGGGKAVGKRHFKGTPTLASEITTSVASQASSPANKGVGQVPPTALP